MKRLLIATILLCSLTAHAELEFIETISKRAGFITNVQLTIHIVTSYAELAAIYEKGEGKPLPPHILTLEGLSNCTRDVKNNTAHCDVWIFEPMFVDDEHTLTLGHEVLHGVFGNRYHY